MALLKHIIKYNTLYIFYINNNLNNALALKQYSTHYKYTKYDYDIINTHTKYDYDIINTYTNTKNNKKNNIDNNNIDNYDNYNDYNNIDN